MKRYAVPLAALILAFVLAACQDPREHFPRWEDAGDVPEAVEGVSLELASMERFKTEKGSVKEPLRDPYRDPYDDWQLLHVTLRLEKERPAPPSYGWHIDYLYEDAWHTVYHPGPKPIADVGRMYTAGEHDCTYAVPAQVLEWPGEYRLCQEEAGTCTFQIE